MGACQPAIPQHDTKDMAWDGVKAKCEQAKRAE